MKKNDNAGPITVCKQNQDTGKRVLTSKVFETAADERPAAPTDAGAGRPAFRLTREELNAATRDDIIYQAVAQIAIRRGFWVVVDSKNAGGVQ